MENNIKVLVYPVGKAPKAEVIDGSLESMQAIVGGYIQVVDLGSMSGIEELYGYDLYCNEEGKLAGLSPNLHFGHDIVVGQCFISKADEEGNSVTLTKQDIKTVSYHVETLQRSFN